LEFQSLNSLAMVTAKAAPANNAAAFITPATTALWLDAVPGMKFIHGV
jgi:hypothetical protein